MTFTINTKFDVGDHVYIADSYYEYYARREQYVIKDVRILINSHKTRVSYEVERDGDVGTVPEAWTFSTYEECTKWCKERNESL